ncbi:MAG: hypothetical protein IPP51_07125 [Bacteroidetes bacterium]|nr:hypothetical protein [Bacteroidota bacterium]
MKLLKSILLLSLFLIAFSACNPTRHVPDGKYLLVKNDIKADSTFLTKEQFEIFNKQKPNRKILGFSDSTFGLTILVTPERTHDLKDG